MRALSVFNSVSLDGYIADVHGDMSWAHRRDSHPDAEWNDFVANNAKGGGTLLFGRVTYQLMASFWPTPMAHEHNPVVAERMNALEKIVFSTTMKSASWNNTRLFNGDLVNQVRTLKNGDGPGIAILGSGSIVSQLAQAGLIDEFQMAIVPVVLGDGKTMFAGLRDKMTMTLKQTRGFANGNVLVRYEPAVPLAERDPIQRALLWSHAFREKVGRRLLIHVGKGFEEDA